MGIREIGRAMGKPHYTISDEIRKNKNPNKIEYNDEVPQLRHELKQLNKVNREKLDRRPKLKRYIIARILKDDCHQNKKLKA